MSTFDDEDEYVTRTVFSRSSGLRRRQFVHFSGLLNSPPDGAPSQIAYDEDGNPIEMVWHRNDLEHRSDGPSTVLLCGQSGEVLLERFCISGQPRDPKLGPYRIAYGKGGETIREEYATERDCGTPRIGDGGFPDYGLD